MCETGCDLAGELRKARRLELNDTHLELRNKTVVEELARTRDQTMEYLIHCIRERHGFWMREHTVMKEKSSTGHIISHRIHTMTHVYAYTRLSNACFITLIFIHLLQL